MIQARDLYADINGVRIHFREWGAENESPLFMLHGSMGNCHNFDLMAPKFARDFRVIAPSARGHGNSSWASPKAYRFDQLAADVFALKNALKFGTITISGQSLGGIIGTFYSARYPEHITKLILGDIGPDTPKLYEEAVNAKPMNYAAARSYDEYMAFTRSLKPDPIEHSLLFDNNVMLNADGTWKSRFDPAFFADMKSIRPTVDEYWAKVKSVRCPTLLIRGENSELLDRSVAEEMRSVMSDCELVEIPGVGHSVMFEAPELVESESLRFLGVGT